MRTHFGLIYREVLKFSVYGIPQREGGADATTLTAREEQGVSAMDLDREGSARVHGFLPERTHACPPVSVPG